MCRRKKTKLALQSRQTQLQLEATNRRFRQTPSIVEFMMQFSKVHTAPCHRYFSLLIRGESRAGKTALAKSLWGAEHTLVVNCQGCTPHLPSIADLDRDEHMAITWDEIDEQQVLQNKVVSQAGASVVTLGQSKCNQYS